MADEQFLTISSIPGEVVDDRHPGAGDGTWNESTHPRRSHR
jgi:hypothetical protein